MHQAKCWDVHVKRGESTSSRPVIGLEMFMGFSKSAKRSTIGPKNLLPLGTFMKVPNMNHCTADARRAFPVLLRESPSDWNKLGGLSGGGVGGV